MMRLTAQPQELEVAQDDPAGRQQAGACDHRNPAEETRKALGAVERALLLYQEVEEQNHRPAAHKACGQCNGARRGELGGQLVRCTERESVGHADQCGGPQQPRMGGGQHGEE